MEVLFWINAVISTSIFVGMVYLLFRNIMS